MKSEPLTIAWSPPELALLGPDGRLLRRRLEPNDEPARRLEELWPAEFPEDRLGRLLIPTADPDSLRRFCAAARRAGTRLVAAGAWDSPAAEMPDHELAERMETFAIDPDLLARRRRMLPRAFATRRARATLLGVVAIVAAGSAVWHVRQEARRTKRTAAAEAAHELEAAQAAAGLRRRQSAEAEEQLLRDLHPPRLPLHELLLALASSANEALVVDQLSAQAGHVRLAYRVLDSAPGAANAAEFPAKLKLALQAAGVAVAERDAMGQTTRAAVAEQHLDFLLPPLAPEDLAQDVPQAMARLPSSRECERLLQPLAGDWIITARSATPIAADIIARELDFAPRELDRGAWERVIGLTDMLEHAAGATIVSLDLAGDGTGSGAFARMTLSAKLLLLTR